MSGADAAAGGVMDVDMLVWVAVSILSIPGMLKTFTKAGKPGWASIVPIHNMIV